MKPTRVAISGAHGTGKTSVIDELARRLPGDAVTVVDEAARALVKQTQDREYYLKDFTLEKQISSCLYQCLREQETLDQRSGSKKLILFDRTMIDSWAYLTLLFPLYAESATAKVLWELIVERSKRTCQLFFVTALEFPLPAGDGRYASAQFRDAVHGRLLDLFALANISVSMLCGPVEKRADQIMTSISNLVGATSIPWKYR